MRSTTNAALFFATALLFFGLSASATIFYHEKFENLDGWVQSKASDDYGAVEVSTGKYVPEAGKKGLLLTQDSHFYAVSKKLPRPVSIDGKPLVVSFAFTAGPEWKCGGGYLKFYAELDQKNMTGDSKYWLMMGPDKCGSTEKVHLIFNYQEVNHDWKKTERLSTETATVHYTLLLTPENKYELYVNGKQTSNGTLEEDWPMLKPANISDPTDSKPEDWDDRFMIDDPEDTKPEDWVDGPETIEDPNATKPEDWKEEDGEWVAPQIPNPEFKGPWSPKKKANPEYKGQWKARQIPNPEYVPDANLYRAPAPLNYVGVEVWQVEGGNMYRDIMLGDDLEEVLAVVKKEVATFVATEDTAAKAMAAEAAKKAEEEAKKAQEEAAAAAAAESKEGDDDEDDDDEGAL